MKISPKWVAGVDGGGTKSIMCLFASDGSYFARTQIGPTNYRLDHEAEIVDEIRRGLRTLRRDAGPMPERLDGLAACLSGLGRPEPCARIRDRLAEARLATTALADSDARAALYGAFLDQPGVILIAGTGSIAFGQTAAGEVLRCGGWGYLLGDEGSGFAIGRDGLAAALHDFDGRGPRTALRARFEAFFEVPAIDHAVTLVYDRYSSRGALAQFAPLVFEEAELGDQAAAQIVERAAYDLALQVHVLARQLSEKHEVPVALLGNLFRRRDLLLPPMQQVWQQHHSAVRLVEPRFPADIGAALLALRAAGGHADAEALAKLAKLVDD